MSVILEKSYGGEYVLRIDEIKTEILEIKTEIKSKHFDDKVYKQSLINVLNKIESEVIELESEVK